MPEKLDLSWFEEMEARIPKGKVRTRFAPSPTGYMHVGNLRTALYTWLIARHAGGTFILRIEDTDQGRLVEGAVDVIYKTMKECHLDHDEGPDVGGPVAPYIQTERRPFYGKYAELLISRGHAYRCFCEKAESEEDSGDFNRGEDPCRSLDPAEADRRAAAGEPYVVRQRIPHEGETVFHDEIFGDIRVENSTLDDQVLMKRDGLPTYNFANVIDDSTTTSWASPMSSAAASISPPRRSTTCSTRASAGRFRSMFTARRSCGTSTTRCPSATATLPMRI